MNKYLKLLRVKHSLKNILIILPVLFGGKLSIDTFVLFCMGFLTFSLLASIIYIFNDIQDVEKDRQHPVKCKRPIASKEISISKAVIIALLLFCFILIMLIINSDLRRGWYYLLIYFIINICYSCGLKGIPIFDLFLLVLGFLLRVLYGGAIFDIKVSDWLYLTVLAASLFLAIGKRRNEMINHESKGTRKVLKFYTIDFLDKNMYMTMGLAITFYSLWAIEHNKDKMIMTIPFVIILCMKYSLDLEGTSEGDPIDVIFNDKLLIMIGVFLFLLITFIIYY